MFLSPLRTGKLPPSGVELVAQVMRALWRFLHDTAHPQVGIFGDGVAGAEDGKVIGLGLV